MTNQIHQRVQDFLESIGSDIGASECHGMLCGALCAPDGFDREAWMRHVVGYDDSAAPSSDQGRAIVDELVTRTEQEIGSPDFAFDLLLPDERSPLAVRAQAFSGWCRGFLSGFGLTGIADLRVLGEDAREFLDDLKRFGSLATDGDGEADERALSELTEFTRMGVLLVRAEATAPGRASGGPPRVH